MSIKATVLLPTNQQHVSFKEAHMRLRVKMEITNTKSHGGAKDL
jgi:hypothetical protein